MGSACVPYRNTIHMVQRFDVVLLLSIKVLKQALRPIGSLNRVLEVPFSDSLRTCRAYRTSFSVYLGVVLTHSREQSQYQNINVVNTFM